MSFWRSTTIKAARKTHSCEYCGKVIQVGESYEAEAGIYEGEFQRYALCLRCLWLIYRHYPYVDDELGNLVDTLFDNDYLQCPSCGSVNNREYDLSEDKQSCECECDNCGHKWTVDLSLDALKRAADGREGE